MNKKIIAVLVWTLLVVPVFTVTATKNISIKSGVEDTQSPDSPLIEGVTNGVLGVKYDYTISSVDPQGDDVFFKIRWGDCSVMNWVGPFESGEEVTFSHAWCDVCCYPGKFTISVSAKDVHNSESPRSTFEVFMDERKPRSIFELLIYNIFNQQLYKISFLRQLLEL
jgi:hypothetical protein